MVASLSRAPAGGLYERTHTSVPLSALRPGKNKGKCVALKLVVPASVSDQPPVCLIMVDAESTCIALCVYNLSTGAPSRWHSERDAFMILDPCVKAVDFQKRGHRAASRSRRDESSDTGDNVRYNFLEVTEPQNFIINGKSSEDAHVFEELKLNLF